MMATNMGDVCQTGATLDTCSRVSPQNMSVSPAPQKAAAAKTRQGCVKRHTTRWVERKYEQRDDGLIRAGEDVESR